MLALATFALLMPFNHGKPSGNFELRSGCGLGAPAFLSFFRIGMFLAFEAVPHGGPMWTASTLPSLSSLSTKSWTHCWVRSSFTAAALSFPRFQMMIYPKRPCHPANEIEHKTPAVSAKRALTKNGARFFHCTGVQYGLRLRTSCWDFPSSMQPLPACK